MSTRFDVARAVALSPRPVKGPWILVEAGSSSGRLAVECLQLSLNRAGVAEAVYIGLDTYHKLPSHKTTDPDRRDAELLIKRSVKLPAGKQLSAQVIAGTFPEVFVEVGPCLPVTHMLLLRPGPKAQTVRDAWRHLAGNLAPGAVAVIDWLVESDEQVGSLWLLRRLEALGWQSAVSDRYDVSAKGQEVRSAILWGGKAVQLGPDEDNT